MKSNLLKSVPLFCLAALLPVCHRVLNNSPVQMIHPFPLAKDIPISVQWYIKDITDLLSYCLIMAVVVILLRIVETYLEEQEETKHNSLLPFVKTWERIFNITFIISIFDLAHYCLSFRQTEWFYLLLNGVFWVMTCYYLFKLKRN